MRVFVLRGSGWHLLRVFAGNGDRACTSSNLSANMVLGNGDVWQCGDSRAQVLIFESAEEHVRFLGLDRVFATCDLYKKDKVRRQHESVGVQLRASITCSSL